MQPDVVSMAERLIDIGALHKVSQSTSVTCAGRLNAVNQLLEFEPNTIAFAIDFLEFSENHPGVAFRAMVENWDQVKLEHALDLEFSMR